MYFEIVFYIFILIYSFILISPFIGSIRKFVRKNIKNKKSTDGFVLDVFITIDEYIEGKNVKINTIYEEYILFILLLGFIISVFTSMIWPLLLIIGIFIILINLILNKFKKQKK